MAGLSTFALVFFFVAVTDTVRASHLQTRTKLLSPPSRFTEKKFEVINGFRMAYVDVGSGDPIVFLHGNPTSSFLWRNVMPHLETQGRLIAPDLIGMGDSDKLPPSDPSRYTFWQHLNFLTVLLERLGVKSNVTLVLHDWGTVLGFTWAYLRRFDLGAVKGIAFMEGLVAPFLKSDSFGSETDAVLLGLRQSPLGEDLILKNNFFINEVLPSAILRNLTSYEFSEYKRPYQKPGEDRRVMLTWPRQIPIDGEPADVTEIMTSYSRWLAESAPFPKLFVKADPGLILVGRFATIARGFKNVSEITVSGLHFIQEDSPSEIGSSISTWLKLV